MGKTRKYVAAPSNIKANFIFAFFLFICVMGENDIFKKKILLVVKFNTFVLLCNVLSLIISPPHR